jgi:uncharacterized protein (DUF2141 family)
MSSPVISRVSVLLGGLAAASQALALDLTVELHGLQPHAGTVIVALYDQARNFPVPERRLAYQTLTPTDNMGQVVFHGLSSGRFAAVAYQDANSNGKLDKNFVGVPTEAYGFSNGARGRMGPPSFEAAAIEVTSDGKTDITLR